jgi:predicted transposase YdaD
MSHDASYKLLFSDRAMVADLLRGFVHEPWVESLDFSTLEQINRSFVSDDLLRHGPDWLYVYLLLEFQATVDRYMAVRIMTYVGLLYQDLIRAGQLSAQARLPPVLDGGRGHRRAHRGGAGRAGALPPECAIPAAR